MFRVGSLESPQGSLSGWGAGVEGWNLLDDCSDSVYSGRKDAILITDNDKGR